jgi:5-formyltetrahydrofolate cyclo-ligase
MNATELKKEKRAVRRAVLADRDALSAEERASRATTIHERFLRLPEVRTARTVMAFWSFGSEVPTRPLLAALAARGVEVALPEVESGGLEVRSWREGESLREASFGAMEPADGARVDPQAIDVVCVPGVAFDLRGRRVGYGGGYYDRFLGSVPRALRAAIAFDLQVVEGDLPAGRFDVPIDVVVTELRTLRCDAHAHEPRRST